MPVSSSASATLMVARLLWSAVMRYRERTLAALALVVVAKLAAVAVPLVLKGIVDRLGGADPALVLPVFLLLAYALLRFAGTLFGEIRDLVFTRVTQNSVAGFLLRAFQHLHHLSARFHAMRRTGGVTRDVERGTAGIGFLLGAALFTVLPTMVEIGALVTVMSLNYSQWFTAIIFLTFVVYAAFTVTYTERRAIYQRALNELDSSANSRLVDSLLNYETVKYYTNEGFEHERFGGILAQWIEVGVQNQKALFFLHIGQSGIIAVGVASVMLLAGQNVVQGSMTVGDLVLVNAYVIQVCLPLNSLGFVFRQARDAVVNAERMFRLMEERPRDRGPRGAGGPRRAARRSALRARRFRLRPRSPDPVGREPHHRAGRHRGGGRRQRLGQIHPRTPAVPLLRRGGRARHDRRPGRARGEPEEPARRAGHRAAGHHPLQRHHRLQHRLRADRGEPRGCHRGSARGARARVHRRAARAVRDAGGRARGEAVGRREAAHRDRPRDPQEPAHPGVRRGHLGARHAHRARHPGRTRPSRARAHDAGDRAPAVDGGRCRRDPGAGARTRGRTRHPRVLAAQRRAVRPDVAAAAPAAGARAGRTRHGAPADQSRRPRRGHHRRPAAGHGGADGAFVHRLRRRAGTHHRRPERPAAGAVGAGGAGGCRKSGGRTHGTAHRAGRYAGASDPAPHHAARARRGPGCAAGAARPARLRGHRSAHRPAGRHAAAARRRARGHQRGARIRPARGARSDARAEPGAARGASRDRRADRGGADRRAAGGGGRQQRRDAQRDRGLAAATIQNRPSGRFGKNAFGRGLHPSQRVAETPAFRPGSRLTALKGGVSNRSQFYDEAGAPSRGFASGAQALAWLAELPREEWPDVLVCELALAHEDGHVVIRQLRELEVRREFALDERLPAIAVGARTPGETHFRALLAGFQGYLAKPFEAADVAGAVMSVAGRRKPPAAPREDVP